jgi:thiamine biosynthesis lipoprotein
MQKIDFRAMGCHMVAALDSDTPNDLLNEVPDWFGEWEKTLSRFREDSELVHLNQQAGQVTPVSATLWAVIQESLAAARRSNGLIVPHLLSALEAAGYDRSFEQLQNAKQLPEPRPPVVADDWRAIEFNSRTRTIRLPVGLRLDLGGIAKGWAADQALKRLASVGPALVDAGGDIAVGAAPQNQSGWPVAIGDPLQPGQQLGLLILSHVGVATSGRDYRKWQQGNIQQHHILDPRTGQPAQTDVLSATVVAPTTRTAETAAKTVLILGSQAGLAWLEAQADLAGLIMREDGSLVLSQSIHNYLWSSA